VKHKRGHRRYGNQNKSGYKPYDRTPPGKRPAHVVVRPKPNEHPDRTIKRFLKKTKKSNIIQEYRSKTEFFEKPSVIRRRKKKRKQAVLKKLRESSGGQ
jgi:ribosomal protein S21